MPCRKITIPCASRENEGIQGLYFGKSCKLDSFL